MTYFVHFEYGNSDCWDGGVSQPAEVTSIREARALAIAHLNNPTSNCRTRVRVRDKSGKLITQYTGY